MKSTEFRKLITDALEHLYDPAYLEVHPLLTQITSSPSANRSTRAQKLRVLLKESIETLRPPQGTPSRSPEWRSYLALRCRYVQGMSIGQVETELGLSRRQLQREIQKGLEALASILWATYGAEKEGVTSSEPAIEATLPDLEIELNQWKLARQAHGVCTLVEDALWLLHSTSELNETKVETEFSDTLAPVFVDATLTRQAIFKILRLVLQNTSGAVRLTAIPKDKYMEILLLGPMCAECLAEDDWKAAKLFINQQDGTLSSENSPETGLRVVISLPLAGQTRVLVIDDNQAILQLIERYLTPHHYEVLKAQSGPEALQLASNHHFDAIILDVMMPNMDGWQVLRSLQQNPAAASTPIIVCSVLKEPELALSLGARAYLKKPVDRIELLTELDRLLRPADLVEAKPQPTPPEG